MAKFKLLEYNQTLLSAIGIASSEPKESTNNIFKTFSICFILFHAVVMFIISSSAFVVMSVFDFSLIMEAAILVIAGVQCVGMFTGNRFNADKIKTMRFKLQETIDKAYSSSVCYSVFLFVIIAVSTEKVLISLNCFRRRA